MANYRQVDTQLWIDDKFTNISPQARLLFLWMFTSPSSSSSGLSLFNDEVCQRETGLSDRELHACMKELKKGHRTKYDDKYNVLWVVNQFKHTPKSPKIIESVLREVESLPSSGIKVDFIKQYEEEFIPYGVTIRDNQIVYDESKKAPKKKSENSMRAFTAKILVDEFAQRWQDEYGIKMVVKRYYFKTMYDLLNNYDTELVKGSITAFFTVNEPYLKEHNHPIGLFLSNVDKYIAVGKKPVAGGRARTR